MYNGERGEEDSEGKEGMWEEEEGRGRKGT